MTSPQIKNLARDLDAKRIKQYVAYNLSLWNLEAEADRVIKTCQSIRADWPIKIDYIKYYE